MKSPILGAATQQLQNKNQLWIDHHQKEFCIREINPGRKGLTDPKL